MTGHVFEENIPGVRKRHLHCPAHPSTTHSKAASISWTMDHHGRYTERCYPDRAESSMHGLRGLQVNESARHRKSNVIQSHPLVETKHVALIDAGEWWLPELGASGGDRRVGTGWPVGAKSHGQEGGRRWGVLLPKG